MAPLCLGVLCLSFSLFRTLSCWTCLMQGFLKLHCTPEKKLTKLLFLWGILVLFYGPPFPFYKMEMDVCFKARAWEEFVLFSNSLYMCLHFASMWNHIWKEPCVAMWRHGIVIIVICVDLWNFESSLTKFINPHLNSLSFCLLPLLSTFHSPKNAFSIFLIWPKV